MVVLRAILVSSVLAQLAWSKPTPIHNLYGSSKTSDSLLEKREVTGIPTDRLITCPDSRDGKDESVDTVQFNDFQIEDATQQGLQSDPGSSDPNPGGYSKVFRNDPGYVFANCNSANLYEYPILADGNVYGGGAPGPFRTIFAPDPDFASRNGIFCGILYHPRNDDGTPSGLFEQCS